MKTKSNPTERAQRAAIALAKVRLQQVNFTSKELTEALRTHGFPYFVEGVSMLKKLDLIAKDADGYYFTTKEPIHFSKLRAPLDELCFRYGKSSKKEKVQEEIVQKERLGYLVTIKDEITVIISEEKLLDFIKQNKVVTIETIKVYG